MVMEENVRAVKLFSAEPSTEAILCALPNIANNFFQAAMQLGKSYATFAPPLGSAHRERGIGTGKYKVKNLTKE